VRRPAILGAVLLLAAWLSEGCFQDQETVSNYNPNAAPQNGPWILALPNPVPARRRGAKTMLTWDTTQGFPGQVYVSVDGKPEQFVSSSSHYWAETAVQRGHTYDFRLYGSSDTNPLSTVRVTCK
jgi:hypothetical protein